MRKHLLSPPKSLPLLSGVLPIDKPRVPKEVVAGVTLAALAIPEVMGYTQIAGMPVITGLYTILLPMLAYGLFGSSRHLVVGADSATAAVMAAGLVAVAQPDSATWVGLAGATALAAAVLLILARLIKLGFVADFLSRTVLVGFLTGVGIQVAAGQVGGLLGIPSGKGVHVAGHYFTGTIGKLCSTLYHAPAVSWSTIAVSASVIVVIKGAKYITKAIPGALIAVIGSIIVSWHWNLVTHGVATLGKVPGGLPKISVPAMTWADLSTVVSTAIPIFVLILAQSAATARAYASKYNDSFSEDVDLVGLGAANVLAGFSGTFVVNGSPTKTQMVDSAGGKSQLSQLVTAGIVAIVLLFLTGPLQYMPKAVLSSVVFLIGIELVDIAGMRRIFAARKDEFVIATLTALTVIVVGVEQGILLAIVISILNHLRRSYHPRTSVLMPPTNEGGDWHSAEVARDVRSADGAVVFRFASSLYYANANKFLEDATLFVEDGAAPLDWMCLDASAITDIDYTGGQTLGQLVSILKEHQVQLVVCEMSTPVRKLLTVYGLDDLASDASQFADPASALAARPAR